MLKNRLVAGCLAVAMVLLCLTCTHGMTSKAEVWNSVCRDERRVTEIRTAKDDFVFNDSIKMSNGSVRYYMWKVPKGTLMGTITTSLILERTSNTASSYCNGINYGYTYGMCYDFGAVMKPNQNKIVLYRYYGNSASMSDAVLETQPSKVSISVWSASEYLTTDAYTPNTKSTGYMVKYTPKSQNDANGGKDHRLTLGLSLRSGLDLSTDYQIKISEEFVKQEDKSVISSGLFKRTYDYVKYNGIGYCSNDRAKKIFSGTELHSSVEWRNVKSSFCGSYHLNAKFVLVDSKTWPDEVYPYSANVYTGTVSCK